MATEGPMIRDGAQCVAAANYYNPVSALSGPNGSGQFLAVDISAARTVSIVSVQGALIYGVLQNTPPSGAAADVAILGVTKMVAGAAITAGAELMTDTSGRFITWAAGAGNYKVGRALEAAGGANVVFTGIVYMPPYKVVT